MDTIREAKQVSAEVPVTEQVKPAEFLYCIRHGKMDKVEFSDQCGGLGHVCTDLDGQADYCCYPDGWAFSAPPEVDEWTPDKPDDPEVKAEMELQEMGSWSLFE